MAALPKAFWPATVVAGAADRIDFKIGATPFVATIAPGTYTSMLALTSAVLSALNAAFGTTWSAAINGGRLSIGCATSFSLQWATGPNLARSAGPRLGFAVSDDAAATSQAAEYQHENGWYADRPIGFDSKPWFRRTVGQTVAFSGRVRQLRYAEQELRTLTFNGLTAWKAKVSREGARPNEALERLWRDGSARFRWWDDGSVEGTYVDLALEEASAKEFNPKRASGKELYSVEWSCRRYVP